LRTCAGRLLAERRQWSRRQQKQSNRCKSKDLEDVHTNQGLGPKRGYPLSLY
jgi:hypothetical protein